jgi:hypothetical protein
MLWKVCVNHIVFARHCTSWLSRHTFLSGMVRHFFYTRNYCEYYNCILVDIKNVYCILPRIINCNFFTVFVDNSNVFVSMIWNRYKKNYFGLNIWHSRSCTIKWIWSWRRVSVYWYLTNWLFSWLFSVLWSELSFYWWLTKFYCCICKGVFLPFSLPDQPLCTCGFLATVRFDLRE